MHSRLRQVIIIAVILLVGAALLFACGAPFRTAPSQTAAVQPTLAATAPSVPGPAATPVRPTNTPLHPTATQLPLTTEPRATATRLPATTTPPRPTATPATSRDGLPTIRANLLPREAQETLRLIDRGGPFPYRQDGVTFQNRERLLPRQPEGYYREYTVETPGSPDRGARRIVAGEGGEFYYTDDHYDSFKRIIRP